MQTDEIVAMTRERVAELVRAQQAHAEPDAFEGDEQREDTRWPFPGTVEVWPAGGDGRQHWLATCQNVGYGGLGMIADRPFKPDTPVEFACHLPEASFYGKATIRHCTEVPEGFLVGVEFNFED